MYRILNSLIVALSSDSPLSLDLEITKLGSCRLKAIGDTINFKGSARIAFCLEAPSYSRVILEVPGSFHFLKYVRVELVTSDSLLLLWNQNVIKNEMYRIERKMPRNTSTHSLCVLGLSKHVSFFIYVLFFAFALLCSHLFGSWFQNFNSFNS